MREKPIARGLLFALAAAVLATAITLKHRAGQRSLANPEAPTPTAHPLTSDLLRCKRTGPDQAVDPGCKTAWRKSQERFFGSDQSRANETSVPLPADRALRSAATSPAERTVEDPSRSGKSSRFIPSRSSSDGAPVH
jgi:conjugative transfer region protein TrbK